MSEIIVRVEIEGVGYVKVIVKLFFSFYKDIFSDFTVDSLQK